MSGPWVVALGDPAAAEVELVGGKGAGLHRLVVLGARVPSGFVVTTAAFAAAVGAPEEIEAPLRALPEDAPVPAVEEAAAQARAALAHAIRTAAEVPVLDAVRTAYRELSAPTTARDADGGALRGGAGAGSEVEDVPVAVRSSAAAEDAADASYAGEHDSYLDVVGPDAVADAVVACWASLYTARAVAYRRGRPAGPMAVVVQRMVAARAAGVFMTLNPANGDRATFVCEAVWGLGEPLVSGAVTPDRFAVNKISGEVVRREIAHKPTRLGSAGTEPVPDAERDLPCLTDDELAELLRIGRAVETAAGAPQDGEFAVDDDGVHLLQARPETVWSQRPRTVTRGRTALEAVLATLTGGDRDAD